MKKNDLNMKRYDSDGSTYTDADIVAAPATSYESAMNDARNAWDEIARGFVGFADEFDMDEAQAEYLDRTVLADPYSSGWFFDDLSTDKLNALFERHAK